MSWQGEMKANMYVQNALRANNEAELERGMQNSDKAVDMLDNMLGEIGKKLTEPSPPTKTSSGGGFGGLLLAGAAVAGDAYLLSKIFGGSDDKESSTTSSNSDTSSKNNADAYISSGNDYYNKRQYERAIRDYTKAIQLNPNSATAYYNHGNAYQAALGGNKFNAKSDFDRAKQLGYYG